MNNILIITESRTVAKTIAQALGANVLHKGYFGKGPRAPNASSSSPCPRT